MKRTAIVFGLISGVIITAMMVYGVYLCYHKEDFKGNTTMGYTAMVVAFSFIFVGIRNYRNKYLGGFISFGKAFKTGLFIALVASTIYVLVWLVYYYGFIPDFMDKYAGYVLRTAEAEGATPAELAAKTEEMATFKELYKSPVMVVLITYAEVLPLGLIIALFSALVLKRKQD
ncbi:DUF4199 domain-containing protein [Parapedobacter koreensis]|uniref:DUF4199 domain-containing protein n=1 Tax=Parapedobacter koreensis TaxID=332977 RepID=A0A1H7JZZ0_9SPHI|nr:DUF4199 domain-containing protein [Parapedobacter koreensis]SEK80082.1 Protein of unknown function [Parapedobacter koreensis]